MGKKREVILYEHNASIFLKKIVRYFNSILIIQSKWFHHDSHMHKMLLDYNYPFIDPANSHFLFHKK